MKRLIPFILAALPIATLLAQSAPAPAQKEPVAIVGGTVHTGDGRVIPNGVVLFENGKITAVDDMDRNTEWRQDRYRLVRADGKHVYPGFIALNSTVGLTEIEAVRTTQDYAETGTDNPNARAVIAYNTDSRVIPTLRSNGVLLAQIVPRGGRWPGTTSVVQLDAWNWEDAAYAMDEGLTLNWPSPFSFQGWWAEPGETNRNKEYQAQIEAIDGFLKEARAYCQLPAPAEKNLRFEALRPLFEGKRKLYINVDLAQAIQDAVLWARGLGITPVIVGGQDSWMLPGLLKENDVPVVLAETQRLPSTADEDIDQPYKTPALLQAAGVRFAISANGYWKQRNLPFHAGQAVPFGLTREQALTAISHAPASIMGLGDRCGAIRTGLDANLFISAGDALDMKTCQVEQAWIQGRAIDLDDHHKQLYRKYKAKYDSQ